METYKRPAIVVSIGREICKASVRSVKGVNIVEFLRQANELLIDVGGHPMAAGFTVHKKNLEKLKPIAGNEISGFWSELRINLR